MRKLSTYLFLVLFAFQTLSWADDIRDFQIEGMSIGDSLLDYFSEKEIIKAKMGTHFKSQKYKKIILEKLKKLELYDTLTLWVKDKDKTYKIYSVEGYVYFKKDMQNCYKKQKEVIAELNDFFKELGVKDDGLHSRKHSGDKSGKSTITDSIFRFPKGDQIQISCMDFSKKTGWDDTMSIAIDTKEYADFLSNEAW